MIQHTMSATYKTLYIKSYTVSYIQYTFIMSSTMTHECIIDVINMLIVHYRNGIHKKIVTNFFHCSFK